MECGDDHDIDLRQREELAPVAEGLDFSIAGQGLGPGLIDIRTGGQASFAQGAGALPANRPQPITPILKLMYHPWTGSGPARQYASTYSGSTG